MIGWLVGLGVTRVDDLDLARRVSAMVILAEPSERESVLQREIPLERFARVLALLPGVMAATVDSIVARDKRHRLAVQGVLRTFLQETKQ